MSGLITDFIRDYPNTDFHEINLDWLLKNYKHIVDSINALNAWRSRHETEYEELLKRTTAIEREIIAFENLIKKKIQEQDDYIARQHQMILDECERCKRQIDAHFENALNHFTNEFDTLTGNVLLKLNQMQMQLNNFNAYLINALEENNAEVYAHVNDMFTDWVDHLPDYEHLIVYNPARGAYTTVQEAINDLYADFNVFGLTAIQYDSLGLSAQAYDDYGLTAREYDSWGYVALQYPDPRYYMIDPFTGMQALVTEVVYKLAHFHMEGLTAKEYDDYEFTAQEYDDKLITAFNYDWFGKDILSA